MISTLSNLWKTEQPYSPFGLLWIFCYVTFQHYFSHTEHTLTSLRYTFREICEFIFDINADLKLEQEKLQIICMRSRLGNLMPNGYH